MRGDIAEYLLVEATGDPAKWVLPKGHIEEQEKFRQTAVREVHEETGVWACIGIYHPRPRHLSEGEWQQELERMRVAADMGNVSYAVEGAEVTVRFYLMEAVGRGLRKDKERRHDWLSLEKAVQRASHSETQKLLQSAEQLRSSLKSARSVQE